MRAIIVARKARAFSGFRNVFVQFIVIVCLALSSFRASAGETVNGAVGYWMTIDDDGKTPTGVVRIFERDHKLYGNIVQLINPPRKDPKCDDCQGAAKGKPVLGLQIIWDLARDDDGWSGGHILDPKNGKVYRCYIELQEHGSRLKVRGYLGIALLGRTQQWRRTEKPIS